MGGIEIKKSSLRTRQISLPFFFAILFVFGFILFASELIENELAPFDSAIYGKISILISPPLTRAMSAFSFLGSAPVLVSVLALFLIPTWKKRGFRFYEGMMAFNLAAACVMNLLFKTIFQRPRPSIARLAEATGFSFPSGHSMVSAAFYGYLIYLCILFLKRPWKEIGSVLLFVVILSIGVSRIYLGVHYASDVAAGFLAGFSWVIFFACLTKRLHENWKPRNARIRRAR